MALFFGIDGCRNEWIAVSCDSDHNFQKAFVEKSIQATHECTKEANLTLIDIPIGLKDKSNPGKRACDVAARKKLGKQWRSVFSVPQRESLEQETYEDAKRKNMNICGVGLTRQTWCIMNKISEVDSLLIRNSALQLRFRETHPEICFWCLNKQKALKDKKKTESGIKERLKIMNGFSENSDDFYNKNRNLLRGVKSDDILDAMAAALTASLSEQFILKTLPEVPEVDSFGLKMEIVYVAID